jgi:hypothetical protein
MAALRMIVAMTVAAQLNQLAGPSHTLAVTLLVACVGCAAGLAVEAVAKHARNRWVARGLTSQSRTSL